MSEPHTFLIESDLDFDGSTRFTQRLGDFTTARQNGRLHVLHVETAFGRVGSTMFGLLPEDSPKVVGIASKFNNPFTVVRVIPAGNDPDSFREELDLTPEIQYLTLYPGDELGIVSRDGGRTSVMLVVNEMGEQNHFDYAIRKPRSLHWRRYRIIRNAPTGFVPAVNADAWRPNFQFDRINHLLIANEVGKGPIPLDAFCTFPEFAGCLVRARFANIDDEGNLLVVEPALRNRRGVGKVPNMRWTKVAWVSHDDHIALRSDPPISDDTTICDIMIAKIHAEFALQGLYDRGN